MRAAVFALLAACSTSESAPAVSPVAPVAPIAPIAVVPDKPATPSCIDDEHPFDADAIKARLTSLASVDLDGRAPGTDGDRTARGLIEARFRCLGLAPAFGDDFAQPFDHDGAHTGNLVGIVKGSSDDIVLVSAHHDHLGKGYLGANDNASGVTALLAIAQAVKQRGTPKRTIVFATFGDEEDGMIGSYYFAKHAPASVPLDRIVEDVNLDMVGSYSSHKLVAAMGSFKGMPARTLIDKLIKTTKGIDVIPGGHSRGSDFEPFCKLGVPFVFLWTPDEHCYHEKCDTLEHIDLPHMVQIAAFADQLVDALADTELDLAASRTKLGCPN